MYSFFRGDVMQSGKPTYELYEYIVAHARAPCQAFAEEFKICLKLSKDRR